MPKQKLSHLINLGSYNKYKGIPSYKKLKQNNEENVSFMVEWERSGWQHLPWLTGASPARHSASIYEIKGQKTWDISVNQFCIQQKTIQLTWVTIQPSPHSSYSWEPLSTFHFYQQKPKNVPVHKLSIQHLVHDVL
jgi:hypothetical protein